MLRFSPVTKSYIFLYSYCVLSFMQCQSVEELLSAEKQNVALIQQANNKVNVSKHSDHYWVVTVVIGTTGVHTSTAAAVSVTQ